MSVNDLIAEIESSDFDLARLNNIDLTDADPQVFIQGLTSNSPSARFVSVKVLGELKTINAVPRLCTALLSDGDEDVRWQSAKALMAIASPSSVDSLITAIHDNSYLVRSYAIKALAAIGNDKAITALMDTTKSDDYDTRLWATTALNGLMANK
jgi:HEAT repeat protein